MSTGWMYTGVLLYERPACPRTFGVWERQAVRPPRHHLPESGGRTTLIRQWLEVRSQLAICLYQSSLDVSTAT